jgi:alanyl-tRNA synthetase
MTSTNDIRRAFLDYFEAGHCPRPSAPLIPHNDPR